MGRGQLGPGGRRGHHDAPQPSGRASEEPCDESDGAEIESGQRELGSARGSRSSAYRVGRSVCEAAANRNTMHAVVPRRRPRLYSRTNRTWHQAMTGSSRGKSQHQRAGDSGNPVRDASNLAPEPSGRTGLARLGGRPSPGAATSTPDRCGTVTSRTSGRFFSSPLRRRTCGGGADRRAAPIGVVPREACTLVPGRGRSLSFSAVFSSQAKAQSAGRTPLGAHRSAQLLDSPSCGGGASVTP